MLHNYATLLYVRITTTTNFQTPLRGLVVVVSWYKTFIKLGLSQEETINNGWMKTPPQNPKYFRAL